MSVEAILMKIEYDREKSLKKGRLPIKNIIPVAEEVYAEGNVLGAIEQCEQWQTITHQRLEDAGNHVVQLGFVVPLEESKGLSIQIGPYENKAFKDEVLSKYIKGSKAYYYIPSYFERTKKGPQLSQVPGRSATDVVCSGLSYVRVYREGDLIHTQPTLVLPAGMSLEQYEELLEDLLYISEDLVVEQKGQQSVVAKWAHRYDLLKEHVVELEKTLVEINKNPEALLTTEWTTKRIHQVKHFSTRTLIDKELLGKEKVSALTHRESLNLYEHRAIKTYLNQLLKLVKGYSQREKREIGYETKSIALSVDDKFNFNEIRYGEIKNRIEEVEFKKENYKQEMLKRHEAATPLLQACYTCEIPLFIQETPKQIKYNPKTSQMVISTEGYNKEKNKYTPFDLGYYDYVFNRSVFKFTSKKLNQLVLKSNHLLQYDFLLEHLLNPNHVGKHITLHGKLTRNNQMIFNELSPFMHHMEGNFGEYYICLEELMAITVSGKTYWFEDYVAHTNQDLEKVCRQLLCYSTQAFEQMEEELGFYEALAYRNKSYKEINEVGQTNTYLKWQLLEDKIAQLLQLTIFKHLSNEQERLNSSPLFRKNQSYRKAYQCIKKLEASQISVAMKEGKELLVKKTEKLYEYWCYIKMIQLLIKDLGFKLEEKNSLMDLKTQINEYLKRGYLEKSSVCLSGKWIGQQNLKITLYFNEEIREGLKTKKLLTPDYHFEIEKNDEVFHIYMDAKYRNYTSQGIAAWKKDLKEVAVEKYIEEFEGGAYEALGSYIIHNDNHTKGLEKGIDVAQYYGLHPETVIHKPNVRTHQTGSIGFLPSNTFYFKNLMRMIMEYFLGNYKHKCWICGNEAIQVEEKLTEAGYKKYHMTCPQCHEFWVKNHCQIRGKNHTLIKHLNNYHQEVKEKERWYVECPECGDHQAGEIKSPVEEKTPQLEEKIPQTWKQNNQAQPSIDFYLNQAEQMQRR